MCFGKEQVCYAKAPAFASLRLVYFSDRESIVIVKKIGIEILTNPYVSRSLESEIVV